MSGRIVDPYEPTIFLSTTYNLPCKQVVAKIVKIVVLLDILHSFFSFFFEIKGSDHISFINPKSNPKV